MTQTWMDRQKPSFRRARLAACLQGWALEKFLPGTTVLIVQGGQVTRPNYDDRPKRCTSR